jgi:predicted O-methyltransferase YrrM
MIVAPDVESYLASLTPENPLPTRAAAEEHAAPPPAAERIVGRFLETLVLTAGARRVLEIGAGTGRRTLRLARSLPEDGGLLSIEIDPGRAATARTRLADAGLGERAHVIIGDPARMVHKVAGPFDVIVDAGDPRQHGPLLDRLAALLRPGGVLVTDRVLRARFARSPGPRAAEGDEGRARRQERAEDGPRAEDKPRTEDKAKAEDEPRAADEAKAADDAKAVDACNRRIAADPRFVTSFVPLGDGVAVSVKVRPSPAG